MGFAPRKEGQIKQKLVEVSSYEGVLVFFESGKRIGKLISVVAELMSEREICLCRELTKLHEEVTRGQPQDFSTEARKGECVLLIGPGKAISYEEKGGHKDKSPLKNIALQLGDLWGINKRDAYNLLQSIKPKATDKQ